jgi:hypothetical protein
VVVDVGPELDLLDLDDLLLLASFVLLLLLLEPELAVVQDLADGGIGVRRDLHQVEPGFLGASSAAEVGMIPCFSPCSSMSRTLGTRMSSLVRGPSLTGGACMGRRMGGSLFCWSDWGEAGARARYYFAMRHMTIG